MGLFGSLIKTVIDVVETPVAIVKDVATLGGALTEQKKSYTEQKIAELGEDWEDSKREIKKIKLYANNNISFYAAHCGLLHSGFQRP